MSDHWGTPDSVFSLIEEHIDPNIRLAFDPCPFKGVDGLKVELWPETGTVFINPPYSNPEPFIELAFAWQANRKDRKVVMVLPAFTDRKWWLRSVQPKLIPYSSNRNCYFIGRHKFIPLDGQKESSPRFGSCLLVIGYYLSTSLSLALDSQARRSNTKKSEDAGDNLRNGHNDRRKGNAKLRKDRNGGSNDG